MAKRAWDKQLYASFELVLSPSQITAFFDCPRKWWFKSCRRMPERKDQSKFVFGNVLHGVIQRWLEADDTGRSVMTGQPVDIYPAGWESDEDNGSVSREEADLIKRLVAQGIADGTLRRLPGREIEKEFKLELIPGKVAIVEYLDVYSREGVEDHKSTKSSKWVASQQELADDPKMLTYGLVWLGEQFQEQPGDVQATTSPEEVYPTVTLRLNYFCKDEANPFTKPVTVEVPSQDIIKFWLEKLVPSAERMLELKALKLEDKDWAKVAGPQSSGVCKKYGGCPYRSICARVQHPVAYRKATDLANAKAKQPVPTATTLSPIAKPMSFFSKKPVAPAVVSEPVEAPAAEVQTQEAPPWHVAGCMACKNSPHGPGFNKAGQPCGACNGVRRRQKLTTSDDYEVGQDENGNPAWAEKELPEGVTETAKIEAPAKPPVVSKPAKPAAVKTPASKPVPAPVAVEPEPELEPEDVQDAPAVEEPKPRKKRQKAAQAVVAAPVSEEVVEIAESLEQALAPAQELLGPVLYINAIPIDEDFVDLGDILAREGAELAQAKGAQSYYALNAFERRDMLAQGAAAVAEEFAGQNIVVRGHSPDQDHFVTALKPMAARTILGVA